MAIHTNRSKIVEAIANREEFDNKTLTGTKGTQLLTGQLGVADRQEFLSDMDYARANGAEVYVTSSYQTPIGWHVEGLGWKIPDTRYSATTSMHQGIVRQGSNR